MLSTPMWPVRLQRLAGFHAGVARVRTGCLHLDIYTPRILERVVCCLIALAEPLIICAFR